MNRPTLDALWTLATRQAFQVTLTVLAVGVITRVLCRNRPHLAFALWLVVLLKCVTPPLWASPTGLFAGLGEAAAPSWENSTFDAPRSSTGYDRVSRSVSAKRDTGITPVLPAVPAIAPSVESHPPIDPSAVALTVWAVGTLLAATTMAVRIGSMHRRVRHNGRPVPASLCATTDELARNLRVLRPFRLAVSDDGFGPAVVGVLRPTVVIPAVLVEAAELDTAARQRLRWALAHELVHVRRLDGLAVVLQAAAVAVWWFYPLVWWAAGQASRVREMSCDEETVAALGCGPAAYGQMVLDVLKTVRPAGLRMSLALGLTATTARLRVDHLLRPAARFRRRTPAWAWAVAVGLAVVVLPATRPAAVTVAANPTTEPSVMPATRPGPRTFHGVVRDQTTGRPIAGATVIVYRQHAYDPSRRWEDVVPPQNVTTDADGGYAFDVTADQAADRDFCLGFEVRHPDYAWRIWLGEGLQLIDREIAKGERPWFEHYEMVPAAAVTGLVLDPAGRPLADCEVSYRSAVGPPETFEIQQETKFTLGQVRTDAAGRFSLNAIRGDSTVRLAVLPENAASQAWDIGPAKGDIGVIHLAAGRRVTGRVVDEAGRGVGDVRVRVEPRTTDREATRFLKTDADGRFDAPPVGPGETAVTVEDSRYVSQTIDVKGDAAPAPLVFKPAEMVTVRGTITDSAGHPTTRPYNISAGGHLGREWYHGGEGVNSVDGRFTLRLPKGLDCQSLRIMFFRDWVMVWRVGTSGPWHNVSDNSLGTLNGDVNDVQYMELRRRCGSGR